MRLFSKKQNTSIKRRTGGFTFLEVIVVVGILVLIATLVATRYIHRGEEAKKDAARIQIKEISNSLEIYRMDNGFYPSQEQGLKALVEQPDDDPEPKKWKKLMDEVPKDPWGNEFIYIYPGEHKDFDLFSKGPDAAEGTDDDIVNWKKEDEETN